MLHSQTNIRRRKRHVSEIDNDILRLGMDENFDDNAQQVGRMCRLIGDEMNETYALRRHFFVLIIPSEYLSNICSTSVKILAIVCRISLLIYWN